MKWDVEIANSMEKGNYKWHEPCQTLAFLSLLLCSFADISHRCSCNKCYGGSLIASDEFDCKETNTKKTWSGLQ